MAIINDKILYDKSISVREAAKLMGVSPSFVYLKRKEYSKKNKIDWGKKIVLSEDDLKLLEDKSLSNNDILLKLLDKGIDISLSHIGKLRRDMKLNRETGNKSGYAKVNKLFTEEEICKVIATSKSKAEACRRLKCSIYSYNKLQKKYKDKISELVIDKW